MLLPVFAYGQPVLKRVAAPIEPDYPGLTDLIQNMWETMYHAEGVGIAAPQVGFGIRLFLADTEQIKRDDKENEMKEEGMKHVFINAQKIEESGPLCSIEEGCLSIPKIRGEVERPETIRLKWLDENFQPREETFTGINARVVQHEYDHIQGVLFTDKLKPLRKRLIQRKLEAIKSGKIPTEYKMKFFNVR